MRKFSKGFVAPSQAAAEGGGCFVRVKSEESARREEPQNFAEFYAQLSAKDGEAPHAFIESKVDPLGFRGEAQKLRYRLHQAHRFLLSPNTKKMQYWDLLMIFLLLYTATVTPYEVCMIWDHSVINSPLFVVNWLVNALFIVDMVMNFFIPYRESYRNGGHLVKSHSQIAHHYLRTWFLIDLISVIPVDTILSVAFEDNVDDNNLCD